MPTSWPVASTSAPPDEPGASGAVCSTLPSMRRPPGPRNARATAETSPNVTRVPPPWMAAAPKTAVPTAEAAAVAPLERLRAGGVDLDHREVAVAVDCRHGAARAAAVGERDGDLVAAQVVGIGQDHAVGDDDAGAARAAADPDDGRADALGDGGDGGLEFFDDAHGVAPGWGEGGLAVSAAVDL